MRQAILRASYRSNQRCSCSQFCRCLGPCSPVGHRFSIRLPGVSRRRFLLIKRNIEQNNLARNLLPAERFQFTKTSDHHHFGGDPTGRRCAASAQGSHHNLLRGARSLPGIVHEFGGFNSTHPTWQPHFLQAHLQSLQAHLLGHIVDRVFRLRRCSHARPDVLGQVRYLAVGVVTR